MSLINDALKRAKDAQQQTPPPSAEHLHLRPVEPHTVVTHGLGFAVPAGFALLALLVLFFGWRLYQDSGRTVSNVTVSAKTPPVPAVTPVPEKAPPVAVEPARAPATAPVAAPPPNPAPEPAKATATAEPAVAATNLVAVEAPKPPTLKLQGITYSRTRPSAVINGKTLFLGDRIREFRLVAIRSDSATLVGGGQTNVLSLSE